MNQFSNTQNSGLLKDYYDTSKPDAVGSALKKKRESLAAGRGILDQTDEEKEED